MPMNLFGTDDPLAMQLANGAHGASVTPGVLTRGSKIVAQGHLFDGTVLDHLRDGEQPHYYFYNITKGFSRDGDSVGGGVNAAFRSFYFVTDERVLLFTKGKRGHAIPLSAITRVDVSHGRLKHRLSVWTADGEYTLYAGRHTDGDELDRAADYIRSQFGEGSDLVPTPVVGLDPIWDDDSTNVPDEMLDADPQGDYVTRERVASIAEYLYDDEWIHYLTRGKSVRVGGSTEVDNIVGTDLTNTGSPWGSVWTAVTDRRIVIRIEKKTKEDGEWSINLEDVRGVDRGSGVEGNRISVHVPSRTYHIIVSNPGADELRELVQYIREWEPEDDTADSDIASAAERLRELQDLHDEGLLTDEEFEAKREKLVDDL